VETYESKKKNTIRRGAWGEKKKGWGKKKIAPTKLWCLASRGNGHIKATLKQATQKTRSNGSEAKKSGGWGARGTINYEEKRGARSADGGVSELGTKRGKRTQGHGGVKPEGGAQARAKKTRGGNKKTTISKKGEGQPRWKAN